ncbi:uncharacterized protein BDW47DRAFT_112857 [Aspergillus candidus]|uniref:Uncharacterized protein n=1 Tax=Aspergillus candidus TaxID=41067 RepID=A0A2I2F0F7_ASPCN|nr:hypothetical protein BDW47DRAFT_112857 [Aspergillus candidus]PLB34103.1 hypothetical protein BDW47DRAFT_112857 [Aspergillus candidus]
MYVAVWGIITSFPPWKVTQYILIGTRSCSRISSNSAGRSRGLRYPPPCIGMVRSENSAMSLTPAHFLLGHSSSILNLPTEPAPAGPASVYCKRLIQDQQIVVIKSFIPSQLELETELIVGRSTHWLLASGQFRVKSEIPCETIGFLAALAGFSVKNCQPRRVTRLLGNGNQSRPPPLHRQDACIGAWAFSFFPFA